MNDKDAQLIWETLQKQKVDETDSDQEPVNRVGDEATGDPSTFQVGQILRSQQTGDHLDGMIIDISEEDGELTFALMEIGEEGWTGRDSSRHRGGAA